MRDSDLGTGGPSPPPLPTMSGAHLLLPLLHTFEHAWAEAAVAAGTEAATTTTMATTIASTTITQQAIMDEVHMVRMFKVHSVFVFDMKRESRARLFDLLCIACLAWDSSGLAWSASWSLSCSLSFCQCPRGFAFRVFVFV